MVVRAAVFRTRGGGLVDEFGMKDASWSETANQAETVSVVIDLDSGSEGGRDWRNLGTEWKHSIALDFHGRLLGGPIMPHNFDNDKGELKLTVRGGRILFTRHSILPVAAMPPRSPTLPNGDLDTTLDTTLAGFDLGTIAKKIGEQACLWPGRDYPIDWPADRAGTHEKTYAAIDRKKVEAAWTDLSRLENGPDIRLALVRDGADAFRWRFQSGTQQQPRLQGDDVFAWELGMGSSLQVQTNPTMMGSLAWSQGGRSDDKALVRGQYDSTLVDAGYPLLEIETDASVNTVDPDTLNSQNAEALRTAKKPWEFWSFKVRADRSPFPYEYGPGSLIAVNVTKDTKVSGGYVAPGTYPRRIAGLSGGLDEWITITCGEYYDG